MVKINMEKPTMQPKEGDCIYNKCSHPNHLHNNGLCWQITQPEEKGLEQFCPCTFQEETHRLYKDLGYTIPGPRDTMVTKPCRGCNKDFMFNLDENFCKTCKRVMETFK